MRNETLLLSSDEALARVDRDRTIDGYFAALSRGEQPKAEGLDVEYLKKILTEAGAKFDIDDLEGARESLRRPDYSEKHPDRRSGLDAIFGKEKIAAYEKWALSVSEETCPRATFYSEKQKKKVPIDGSQDRGLKMMLADLAEALVGGKRTIADFVRRTDVRVRFGIAYATMKKMKAEFGVESKEYISAKDSYMKMDKAKDTKGIVMIPVGSLEIFWDLIRSGELPH